MDIILRLKDLSKLMELEPAEDTGCPKLSQRQQDSVAVSNAVLPNGMRISLLKTMLTSACERDCYYCPFRSGRNYKRATLKPEEMARAFMSMYKAGVVKGIFLSSGVAGGGVRTQDKLLETAEILRNKHAFRGYLHLKIMPGVEREQVMQAMIFADRVSLNLEAPNTQRLQSLAPHKVFVDELLEPLRWVEKIRTSKPPKMGWNKRWPSTTTQFVVGAVGESDIELLSTTTYLHKAVGLSRAYYSAFNPIPDTPLENHRPTPPVRQQRLYQASFLLRDYGFCLEDLPFEPSGILPEKIDPKTAWAKIHLQDTRVEINNADRHMLLRIPGFGPKGVRAILKARIKGRIKIVDDLRKIGINPDRSLPFILLDGRSPDRQLSFW